MMFKITSSICILHIKDESKEDGTSIVDLGNYYEAEDGRRVLITSRELAEKYGHLVDEDIYVRKAKHA